MLGFLGCFIVCMAFQKSSVDNAYQVYEVLLCPVLLLSRTIVPGFPVSAYPAGRYIYDVALSVTKIPYISLLHPTSSDSYSKYLSPHNARPYRIY